MVITDEVLLEIAEKHTASGAEIVDFNSMGYECYAVTLSGSDSLFYVRDYTQEIEPIIAAQALRDAAKVLMEQGVVPWDRNALAIQTLNFLADQLYKETS